MTKSNLNIILVCLLGFLLFNGTKCNFDLKPVDPDNPPVVIDEDFKDINFTTWKENVPTDYKDDSVIVKKVLEDVVTSISSGNITTTNDAVKMIAEKLLKELEPPSYLSWESWRILFSSTLSTLREGESPRVKDDAKSFALFLKAVIRSL